MQVIPVFGSLLLAFLVSGISMHLCNSTPRIASPRCTSLLYWRRQTGVRIGSGKLQTGAERAGRDSAALSDVVIWSVRRDSCFGL